jgi:hypothetical protein
VVIKVLKWKSLAKQGSKQHQTTEETRVTIHVEPILKSRRNRNDKTAKRGMAVLHQYPIKFLYFFNIHSLLGSSNMYGWVVWVEKVPHRWHEQAAKTVMARRFPRKFVPQNLCWRGMARAKNRICSNDLLISE